jgi:hypothetical protein
MAERQIPGGFKGPGGFIPITPPIAVTGATVWSDNNEYSASLDGAGDPIVWEAEIQFDAISTGVGSSITAALDGIGFVTANTGTVSVVVGATAPGNTAGGTVRATGTFTNLVEAAVSIAGAAFLNPGGLRLVQITLGNSNLGQMAHFRGFFGRIG